MCGICGILRFDASRVERETLVEMNQQIVHRGPDDAGLFLEGGVGLAMRRLSIIDVQSGHQPISNEEGNVWVVFNGEIYNHQELRRELEARGHRYRTHSDTETIVHLYEEHGRDCVQYLRGMFAFVIWDARSQKLFAARDRLGIKPFYYLRDQEKFLFGSEIKTLLPILASAHRSIAAYCVSIWRSATSPARRRFLRGYGSCRPGTRSRRSRAGNWRCASIGT